MQLDQISVSYAAFHVKSPNLPKCLSKGWQDEAHLAIYIKLVRIWMVFQSTYKGIGIMC